VSTKKNLAAKGFNTELQTEPVIKAALTHFWFASIHPLEDGSARTAYTIGEEREPYGAVYVPQDSPAHDPGVQRLLDPLPATPGAICVREEEPRYSSNRD
jgi:hypothetical protein